MNRSEVFNNLDKVAGYKGNMIDSPSYIIILSDIKIITLKIQGT
uniref:Nitroreductase family protein n=1 Tax=Clostridioides difficile TaxID=1496 RepID=A0A381I7J3_CLODI|nr:nitroreductase family protein [Clostridioides difficile]